MKYSKINLIVRFKARNTLVSVTGQKGYVFSWASGGSCGFKGSRKKSTAAIFSVTETVAKSLRYGLGRYNINVYFYGIGRIGPVAQGLKYYGVKVLNLQDLTGIPHNGVSLSKKRKKKKRTRKKRTIKVIKLLSVTKSVYKRKKLRRYRKLNFV